MELPGGRPRQGQPLGKQPGQGQWWALEPGRTEGSDPRSEWPTLFALCPPGSPCVTSALSRRRIRICCDELNLLVPFCNAETDKATTLQWTTAFLKYIQERHGDSLKKVSV